MPPEPEPEPEPEPLLVALHPGDQEYLMADSQLQNTWIKKDAYSLMRLVAVHRVNNPRLISAYETYRAPNSIFI